MTRSVFDPTGPDMDNGRGNRFLGEQAKDFSHMPPAVQEQPAQDKVIEEGEAGEEAANNDEAAQRLEKMVDSNPPDERDIQQSNVEIDRVMRGDKA